MFSSDIAQYYDYFLKKLEETPPSLSFLSKDWPDIEGWRAEAKAKVHELTNFKPKDVPLNASVDSRWEDDGLVYEQVSYDLPYGPRAEGCFILPKDRSGERLPAVIALHDHGGFKYFGWQKIVPIPDEPRILTSFKLTCYEGRSWATELARRGYAVLAMDAFAFGSRRMDPLLLTPDMLQLTRQTGVDITRLNRGDDGSAEYIEAYHAMAAVHEHTMAKSFFLAGTTWSGIFSYEDRRSLHYLVTRPEVDLERIGCGGLSGGGIRTIFLGGLEDQVRCAVCVGFMATHASMLRAHCKSHTWMYYVPLLSNHLDMPDLMALRVPCTVWPWPSMVTFFRPRGIMHSDRVSPHSSMSLVSR